MGQRFRSAGMAGQFQQILAVTLLCEVNFHIVPLLRWFLRFTSHNTLLSIIDTSRHASYEHRESVMDSLVDLLTQSRLNLLLGGVQFLRSVSSETATV